MSFDTLNNSLAIFTDGNGNKWFKAKVITNVDPLNLDRVQVSLPGIYDPDLGDVPWCGPMKMSPFGFGSGYGVFGTPVVGSDVMVCMQAGDVHYPMYMHVQCFANPSDFPSGQAWGFIDPKGNKLVVNDKDIKFESGGGFQLHIDATGNFTVTAPAGKTGTWNVPHAVWNVTDMTINASTLFKVIGMTNINNATIDPSGNTVIPGTLLVNGSAIIESMVVMLAGMNLTGTATANGHNIAENHRHFNQSGAVTGVVST